MSGAMLIDSVSIAVRALGFIALFQAAGTALFMALFTEELKRATSQAAINKLGQRAAILGISLVLIHHALEAGRMAGNFAGVMYPSLQRMTLHSTAAFANMLRVVGLLWIAVGTFRGGQIWRITRCFAALLIAVSFVVTGHTTAYPPHWLLAALLMLHVVIVAFWFGSLAPLYLLVRKDNAALSVRVITSFSMIATACVPVIAIAGGVLAWLLLPSWSTLLEPYGLLLLTKIVGFAVLLGLAALNKWRLTPALSQRASAKKFRRVVIAEYALMCVVLSATALMTGLFSPE